MKSEVVALVPVKDFHQAKSRLAPDLSPSERSALAQWMVQDVLSALTCIPGLTTMMVTDDAAAQRIATQFKIRTVPNNGMGETAVIESATRDLVEQGAAGCLVIPGDVPLLTVEEVQQLLAAQTNRGTVLAPSCSGRGTNAVLRMPPDLFGLQFGDDSFVPHLAKARDSGEPCKVLRLPGVGLDVDDADDLRELLSRPGQTRTHSFLLKSGIADRVMVHARV